ncbi:MAG: hypothetical protein NTX26_00320 [Candidatus Parcubacteria bacterium]|nr:hypothetical protein [Candidatus Parcubacteria bacterium]
MNDNLENNQSPPTIVSRGLTPAIDSKRKKNFLRGFIIALSFLFVFNLGIGVGREMERFACNWTASYHKNFGGPEMGFIENWRGQSPAIINGRGVAGKILQINADTLVIQSQNNIEIIVVMTPETQVTKLQDQVSRGELKMNDFIVVVGNPNVDGQIVAKLIRILP